MINGKASRALQVMRLRGK